MGNRSTIYSNLSDKFKSWLEKRGVDGRFAASNHYVANLKAIGEPIQPHTVKGAAWNGLYELLTGDRPNVGVFNVRSLGEFSANYGKAVSFFTVEKKAKEQVRLLYPTCANFDDLFDFAYDSTQGDGGHTKHAFVKYCQFLCELESQIITVTPGTALPLAFSSYGAYLSAIRTKPFVLLAGISGTGKSRLVRQLARGCCPESKDGSPHPLRDERKPGNFEMIQVRPNWHDSSELMGYVSRIVKAGDPPKYVMMPFVEFLAKAWVYREVPFFLCLDEMNLAPFEQYFAEYLSVIETRKLRTLGPVGATIEAISTDPIIRWDSLEQATLSNAIKDLFDGKDWAAKAEHGRVAEIQKLIAHDKGIRIPPNLVVMGTVNMDETTCSFSRKVLDRAMSFELNDVADMYDPAKLGTEGECDFATIPATAAEAKLLTGKDAYESPVGQTVAITDGGTKVGDAILKILKTLNEEDVPAKKDDGSDSGGTMPLLAKTPFKIAYRTRNEIMIYCVERIGNGLVALPQALDEAISMKILSRIEGDSRHVQKKWLVTLSAAIESELSKLDGYVAANCTLCKEKLADMAEQADYGYTSFWTR